MGSALDLWTAYREQAFGASARPWVGYLFLLEDCLRSTTPVGVKEPHFKVLPEFRDSSYARRYELFCRRLVLEKHYDCSALLLWNSEQGASGGFSEPAPDLTFKAFANSLVGRLETFYAANNRATTCEGTAASAGFVASGVGVSALRSQALASALVAAVVMLEKSFRLN
jgi:hypothetical protein